MSTGLLMASGVAIILTLIAIGICLGVFFERRKRARYLRERDRVRSLLRAAGGGRH